MKYGKKFAVAMLLASLAVSGCDKKSSETDVFQYKNTDVGNNTAVGNVLNALPVTAYSKSFQLATKQPPYGIILNYDGSESQQQRQQIIVYTATYLFALVNNVDWISYNFADQQYMLSKEQLQSWYAADLNDIQTADELEVLINRHINDADNMQQLLDAAKEKK